MILDSRAMYTLDELTPKVWICTFHDTTLLGLDGNVLDRGIGQVGSITIPDFIWDMLAPDDFALVAASDLGLARDIS